MAQTGRIMLREGVVATEPATERLTASLRVLLAFLAFVPVALKLGWPEPLLPRAFLYAAQVFILLAYTTITVLSLRVGAPSLGVRLRAIFRREPIETGMLIVTFGVSWWWDLFAVALTILLLLNALRLYLLILQTRIAPGIVFVGTYVFLAIVGAAALKMPNSTPPDQPISTIDALFTSTSAVCVTGLIVLDTPTAFTRLGHTIIITLIQLGGLGIVVFGSLLALLLGSSLGVRASRMLAANTPQGQMRPAALRRLVLFIVLATLIIEAVGAISLYLAWPDTWIGAPDLTASSDRLFHSVFFSISAFCNAGFATSPNSLEGLRFHWTTHTVMAGLIFVGGVGYPVFENIRQIVWARVRRVRMDSGSLVRMNLHTKLVLSVTGLVYVLGTLGILLDRMMNGDVALGSALLDAHFNSLASRTAGFDSFVTAENGMLGRFVLMFLMFIGGAPGSTAGGIKVIVLGVLLLTVWATIVGRSSTEAFGRRISDEVVRRAATLIVLGLIAVITSVSLLMITERHNDAVHAEMLMFEAISACATTGLSLGATPHLSDPGRVVVIVSMLVGRLGPLAVLAALLTLGRSARTRYQYPSEDVLMS